MPTYEYKCAECSHSFERRQRYDEEAVAMCPLCRGRCRRVIHASPIIFKGSGFYATSHRNPTFPEAAASKTPSKDTSLEQLRSDSTTKLAQDMSAAEKKMSGGDKK